MFAYSITLVYVYSIIELVIIDCDIIIKSQMYFPP